MGDTPIFSRNVEYFLRCSDFRSFREAAHYLGITQPALSESIRQLETQLGVRLFERSRGGIVLTRTGKGILDELRPLREASLKKVKALIEKPSQPILRIGAQEHFARKVLFPHVAKLGSGFPPMRVYLGDVFKLHRAVEEGHIDFGFFVRTDISASLVYRKIRDERYAIMGLTTRFAHIAKAKSMDDLKGEPWIDGRYRVGDIFAGSLHVVIEDQMSAKLATLAGMGIVSNYLDVFTDEELKRLTFAPFKPTANSPENPFFPSHTPPALYLVHRKKIGAEIKQYADGLFRAFRK